MFEQMKTNEKNMSDVSTLAAQVRDIMIYPIIFYQISGEESAPNKNLGRYMLRYVADSGQNKENVKEKVEI